MKKSEIYLIILLICTCVLLSFFILFPDLFLISEENINEQKISQIAKSQIIKENYKKELNDIFINYVKVTNNKELTLDLLSNFRTELLNLKVPAEYKDLHLNLAFTFDKMEKYINEGNEEERLASQQLVNEAKANYGWLGTE
ncbi:MAG: hypothetical protein ABIG60_03240 [Patescibacteria group bacterium]